MSEVEAIFTIRELDVMAVLWERGSGTVAEVRERLTDEPAYTTVLTILRTLERKGFVEHTEEGRAHRYHPKVGREQAQDAHLRRLVLKLFGGSPSRLVRRLLELGELSETEVTELRESLARPSR
jgi:BlaI family transcriptional regulator, penicillinase repressor